MPIRTIGGVFDSSSEFDLPLTIIITIFAALDFGVPVVTASAVEGGPYPSPRERRTRLMRIPDGAALILTGSGIYWVLSSQLIASFSVLTPELFQTNSQGILLVLTTGVVSSAAGLWGIGSELEKLQELFNRREGWLYTVPIILAVSDISLTLVGLRARPGIVELNPFVASAIEAGAAYLISFTICYILMSEGLALLLLDWGRWLFARTPALAYLPFCLICGTAALGPFSNIALITISDLGDLACLLGLTGAAALAASLYYGFGQASRFSLMEGPKGSSP